MRKVFVSLIITAMAITAFALPTTARAEESVISAKILNRNQNTVFHSFVSPSDVFFGGDELYITTADGVKVFSDKTIRSLDVTASDFAYIEQLITLNDGDICYSGQVIQGDYTDLTSYGDTLYALTNNVIYKYSYVDGALSQDGIYAQPALQVTNLAATDSGCAYTVIDQDGYTNLIYNGNDALASIDEDIIDLEYNGKIYALTASKIRAYTDSYDHTDHPIVSAKSISVGDKVYVLTRTGNVDSLSLDLADSQTLIAASGEIDWFYSSVSGGASRLGKIYVADKQLNRVAVICGNSISYITGLNQPVAVAADNSGKVFVAHYGNRVACFDNGVLIDQTTADEVIVDLQIDYNNDVYYLTQSGKVIKLDGEVIRHGVKAFEFNNGWHYMTSSHIDDVELSATAFCVDASGSIFAASGNVITAVVGGVMSTFVVENASKITSIEVSKVSSDLVRYGDLILFDEGAKCVLTVDGQAVGSVDVSQLYTSPELSDQANERADGCIGVAQTDSYLFTLPVEGEIARAVTQGEYLIICKDVPAPQPYYYCLAQSESGLVGGFIYSSAIRVLDYQSPKNAEAKVNADNTPIYKYPSTYSPVISSQNKGDMISILPLAVNYSDSYGDGWYVDHDQNKWYRIAYGEDKEGYILCGDTNVNFFSDMEMPQTNATIICDTTLYRYDEATDSYVEFEAAGLYIAKDTRVAVELPFDTSRKYTKIVFYREGYGTIDAECYVRTENVKFDGVDIVKIVAIVAIVVAAITLLLVVLYRRKISKRTDRR